MFRQACILSPHLPFGSCAAQTPLRVKVFSGAQALPVIAGVSQVCCEPRTLEYAV